jgi:hypothetical protein
VGRRRYERRRQKQDAALEAAALHLNERRTKAKEPAGRRRYEKRTQHSPDFRASTVRRGGASGTAGAHGRVNPFVPQGKPALRKATAERRCRAEGRGATFKPSSDEQRQKSRRDAGATKSGPSIPRILGRAQSAGAARAGRPVRTAGLTRSFLRVNRRYRSRRRSE